MTPFKKTERIFNPEQLNALLNFLKEKNPKLTDEQIHKVFEEETKGEIFKNDVYTVIVFEAETAFENFPEMFWLSIKRNDKEPIHDWRDLQKIKNEIIGKENEGCEIFPSESRLVDSANQYHLWVFKNPTIRFPFGFQERFVNDEHDEATGIKQRKFSINN